MSNPFPVKFNSSCQSCGTMVLMGDEMYAVDGAFLCESCAEKGDNVCDCGNFKKDEYDECYECFNS